MRIQTQIAIALAVLAGAAVLLGGCRAKKAEPPPKKQPAPVKKESVKPVVIHEAPGTVQPSGVQDDLLDVFFVGPGSLPKGAVVPTNPPTLGLAVGKANTVLRTTDGGRTWKRVMERREKGSPFDRVVFNTSSSGWIGDRDVLFHTDDGGETWAAAPMTPGIIPYFGPFTVISNAFLQMKPPTCGASIHRTADGSAWTALEANLPQNNYEVVCFFDNSLGWVAGKNGSSAFTTDGGKTWEIRKIPGNRDVCQIQFVTPEAGWCRTTYANEGGVLRTTDGGKSWQAGTAGIPTLAELMDMQLLDEKLGFLLIRPELRVSQVLRTTDGGKTWTRIGTHRLKLTALSFVDANRGWVVGECGCIFHYDLGMPAPTAAP